MFSITVDREIVYTRTEELLGWLGHELLRLETLGRFVNKPKKNAMSLVNSAYTFSVKSWSAPNDSGLN
jgi:hypothetical protein